MDASILSMTLGRALVIPEAEARAVPLPASIDDEYLSAQPGPNNEQPAGIPSTMEFFVQSLKLSTSLEEILSKIYSNEEANVAPDTTALKGLENLSIDKILHISAARDAWHESIPAFVWTGTERPVNLEPVLVRQENILHIR